MNNNIKGNGQIISIIGEAGTGKTTFALQLVSCLDEIIKVNHRDIVTSIMIIDNELSIDESRQQYLDIHPDMIRTYCSVKDCISLINIAIGISKVKEDRNKHSFYFVINSLALWNEEDKIELFKYLSENHINIKESNIFIFMIGHTSNRITIEDKLKINYLNPDRSVYSNTIANTSDIIYITSCIQHNKINIHEVRGNVSFECEIEDGFKFKRDDIAKFII